MQYREIAPGGEAARFVERYWTLSTDGAGPVQRVVPDGSPELILNLGDPFEARDSEGRWQLQPRAFFAGQTTAPLLLRPSGRAQIIGIHFHPQGAAHLLRAPMQELTGRFLPLSDLGLAQLAELSSIPEIEAHLLQLHRNAADPIIDEAVRRLTAAAGACDIAVLARYLGLSTRHLERRFLQRVGLTPKLYARMRRFQSVWAAVECASPTWAAAAIACGYYDQAHLIRDCREFAGEPPAAVLAGGDLARHFLSHFSKTRPDALG